MNIGDKVYKPIITQEECDTFSTYSTWCNENNCVLKDKGEYYEVVENAPIEPLPIVASQLDRIEAQVMYTALLTDTLIESEVE